MNQRKDYRTYIYTLAYARFKGHNDGDTMTQRNEALLEAGYGRKIRFKVNHEINLSVDLEVLRFGSN